MEPHTLMAIANQRTGTVSIADATKKKVLSEVEVGQRLADLAAYPGSEWLLAVDERGHELVVLKRIGESLIVAARHPVSPYPVSVAISPSGKQITVASLWSRALTVFAVDPPDPITGLSLRQTGVASLSFNPRLQAYLRGPKGPMEKYVAVADAFGGRFAVVDTKEPKPVTVHQVPGGNIYQINAGQLAVSLSHQVSTTIFPGLATDMPGSPMDAYTVTTFGGLGLISGTAQLRVTVGNPQTHGYVFRTPDVRPFRTANGVEVFVPHGIALGPAIDAGPADRGEELFFDRRLSSGQWMSCHSCHTNGHTSGELADTLGDETEGTPKRIPTLLGTRLTDPWAWSGKVRELNEQVRKSLATTLHATQFTSQEVDDITAYLHTLPPPPPLEPATDHADDKARLSRGQSLFKDLGCAKCHVPPLTYTSPDAYDVGLTDEKGMNKFNPPSLRGVSQGYSFFHDGRAKTLEEVFTVVGHQLDRELTSDEMSDLIRFLRSL